MGQKIDLDYNIETMRITDPGDSAEETSVFRRPKPMPSLSSSVQEPTDDQEPETEKVSADVQSARLKQLLNKIKSS